MHFLVMSLFSSDLLCKNGNRLRYLQCLKLTRVQYSHHTWFLAGRTSILVHDEYKIKLFLSKSS